MRGTVSPLGDSQSFREFLILHGSRRAVVYGTTHVPTTRCGFGRYRIRTDNVTSESLVGATLSLRSRVSNDVRKEDAT